ncbi:EamA family transporter [Burkholderia sp. Bp9031]|uniref:EamA family transporter n=1 Tax=Burkholderia sp. Bp9031 TaxID=2184566 RepID=UPI0021AB9884|nr:EamA family transporter [Burkholderia sp. Bp9031]
MLPWSISEFRHVPINITTQGVAAAVYLGVVVTVAGLLLWLNLLRVVPARVAASVQCLQPLVGIVAGSAKFGDTLGASFVGGVLLVLTGLVLTMSTGKTPR